MCKTKKATKVKKNIDIDFSLNAIWKEKIVFKNKYKANIEKYKIFKIVIL